MSILEWPLKAGFTVIAYVQKPSSNTHAYVSSRARGLNFGPSLPHCLCQLPFKFVAHTIMPMNFDRAQTKGRLGRSGLPYLSQFSLFSNERAALMHRLYRPIGEFKI